MSDFLQSEHSAACYAFTLAAVKLGIRANQIEGLSLLELSHEDNTQIVDTDNLILFPGIPNELSSNASTMAEEAATIMVCADGSIYILNTESQIDLSLESKRKLFNLLDCFPGTPFAAVTLTQLDNNIQAHCQIDLNKIAADNLKLATDIAISLLISLFPSADLSRSFFPSLQLIDQDNGVELAKISQSFQLKYPSEWFYRPVMIDIELSHRCNLECAECAILEDVKRADPGLPTNVVQRVLEECEKLGMYSYALTGGEPLLRPDNVLEIIESNPKLDCHKIQTNGTYFSNHARAEKFLYKLWEAGFGKKNKYITSGLHCSVGIQNYIGGATLEGAANLADLFYSVCDSSKAQLRFSLTHHVSHSAVKARRKFQRSLQLLTRKIVDLNLINVRTLILHPSDNTMAEYASLEHESIESIVERYSQFWHCFSNVNALTPFPKILLRANGDVYTCSCFGHVFKLGSVHQSSMHDLIEKANQIELFKMIHDSGLKGVLGHVEKSRPGISKIEFPVTSSICKVCSYLKNEFERSLTDFEPSSKRLNILGQI